MASESGFDAAGAGLVKKYGNKSARPGQRPKWPGKRYIVEAGEGVSVWDCKRWLWSNSRVYDVGRCMRVRRASEVGLKFVGGHLCFDGLVHCRSIWACPTCSPFLRRHRASVLSRGMVQVAELGCGLVFVTLTYPHSFGMPLKELFGRVTKGWAAVCVDKGVRRVLELLGKVGWVRSLEVTYGENGWHPHLHLAFVFDRRLERAEVLVLLDELFRAWCSFAKRSGYPVPSRRYGVQGSNVLRGNADVAKYLSKVEGLSQEMLRLDTKRGRVGGVAPFEILRAVAGGMAEAEPVWYEYEAGSFGRKALSFASKLQRTLGIKAWELDNDLMIEPGVHRGTVVGSIEGKVWDQVVYHPQAFDYLSAVITEQSTPEHVRAAAEFLYSSVPAECFPEWHPYKAVRRLEEDLAQREMAALLRAPLQLFDEEEF